MSWIIAIVLFILLVVISLKRGVDRERELRKIVEQEEFLKNLQMAGRRAKKLNSSIKQLHEIISSQTDHDEDSFYDEDSLYIEPRFKNLLRNMRDIAREIHDVLNNASERQEKLISDSVGDLDKRITDGSGYITLVIIGGLCLTVIHSIRSC